MAGRGVPAAELTSGSAAFRAGGRASARSWIIATWFLEAARAADKSDEPTSAGRFADLQARPGFYTQASGRPSGIGDPAVAGVLPFRRARLRRRSRQVPHACRSSTASWSRVPSGDGRGGVLRPGRTGDERLFHRDQREMKKVSWSTWPEVPAPTKVVILAVLMLGYSCSWWDLVFMAFFSRINVLEGWTAFERLFGAGSAAPEAEQHSTVRSEEVEQHEVPTHGRPMQLTPLAAEEAWPRRPVRQSRPIRSGIEPTPGDEVVRARGRKQGGPGPRVARAEAGRVENLQTASAGSPRADRRESRMKGRAASSSARCTPVTFVEMATEPGRLDPRRRLVPSS